MATKYNKYYQQTFNISTSMTSATFLLTYNLNYNFSLTDDDKLYYRVFFGLNDEENNTYNGKLTFVPNSSEFMVTEGSKKIDNIKINLKNVDNTKTAAEIYITYSFNNLTDFLGKTYSIKYNNKDNIEIEIILKKDVNKFKLEVKDNGIGIPKNEINNVMKRFYKVDKSRVNNNSFGIGLSIANRIANNYNAKIQIDSELDKYTRISVYFN